MGVASVRESTMSMALRSRNEVRSEREGSQYAGRARTKWTQIFLLQTLYPLLFFTTDEMTLSCPGSLRGLNQEIATTMGLSGGSSDAAIEHDVVESWRHELDKQALANRKKGEWIFVPRELEHEFTNDFCLIGKTEALYFKGAGIPTIRVKDITPESWDEAGTIASFPAGSGAVALREFFRSKQRRTRGRKAKDGTKRELPEPPPGDPMAPPVLTRANPLEHLKWLRAIRNDSQTYHRWGTGADRRPQWKPTLASTRTKAIEGDAEPVDLDAAIARIEGDSSAVPQATRGKKRIVRSDSDLRRCRVNSHPALARALSKMVADGEKKQVIAVMEELAPGVAGKFQEITARQCMGCLCTLTAICHAGTSGTVARSA